MSAAVSFAKWLTIGAIVGLVLFNAEGVARLADTLVLILTRAIGVAGRAN